MGLTAYVEMFMSKAIEHAAAFPLAFTAEALDQANEPWL
jgi:hypothetical protein